MEAAEKMRGEPVGTILSDEQLIELYWQRDESAIEKTEVKYGEMLFRMAYHILQDRLDCEECKNDTYLGVWTAIPPTRPAVLPAFLTRIMRNVAVKRYRAKTSQKRIPSQLTVAMDDLYETLHHGDTPEVQYTAKELGTMISAYVRSLSERQQYLFMGRFYMAETMEYLAARLGISVSSVHRNLEKMKQGLKEYLESNEVYV